jgi:uncharacterized repeat protein (TIGR02543 family)
MATIQQESDLITACRIGLNISASTTALDDVIKQKLMAVKAYLSNAGVSDADLYSDLAVGVIVMGVTDMWNLSGGQVSFSPMFHTLAAQLALKSYAESNAFRIAYDGNGNTSGKPPIDNNTYQQSDNAIALDNLGGLARTGFMFAGWNTAASGSATDYAVDGLLRMGSSDVTLYAKWVPA